MKTDIAELRANDKSIVKALVRLEATVDSGFNGLKTYVDVRFNALMQRMDGFAAMLERSGFEWAKHKVRLEDHERRVARLEAKSKRH